jgi:hypothetical protein
LQIITQEGRISKSKEQSNSLFNKNSGWYRAFLSTSLLGIQPDQVSCSRESRRGNKENEGEGKVKEKGFKSQQSPESQLEEKGRSRKEKQRKREGKGYFCTPAICLFWTSTSVPAQQ